MKGLDAPNAHQRSFKDQDFANIYGTTWKLLVAFFKLSVAEVSHFLVLWDVHSK